MQARMMTRHGLTTLIVGMLSVDISCCRYEWCYGYITVWNNPKKTSLIPYNRLLGHRPNQDSGCLIFQFDVELVSMACATFVQLNKVPASFCVLAEKTLEPASLRLLLLSRFPHYLFPCKMCQGSMPQSNSIFDSACHYYRSHFRLWQCLLPCNEIACVCMACYKAGT